MGVVPRGDTLTSATERVNHASLDTSPQFSSSKSKGISVCEAATAGTIPGAEPAVSRFRGTLSGFPGVPRALNSCCRAPEVLAASQVSSTRGDQVLHCRRVCPQVAFFTADSCLLPSQAQPWL